MFKLAPFMFSLVTEFAASHSLIVIWFSIPIFHISNRGQHNKASFDLLLSREPTSFKDCLRANNVEGIDLHVHWPREAFGQRFVDICEPGLDILEFILSVRISFLLVMRWEDKRRVFMHMFQSVVSRSRRGLRSSSLR